MSRVPFTSPHAVQFSVAHCGRVKLSGCIRKRYSSISLAVHLIVSSLHWLDWEQFSISSAMSNNSYEEIKFVLIEKVRAVPAIWDKNHEQHHNRYVLHKHWKRIAGDVGMREDKVKRVWRNLRQEFGKQIKKVIKSGIDAYENVNTQWPFYPCLLFLKDQFITSDTSNNIAEIDVDASDTFDDIQEEFEYENDVMSDRMHSRSPSIISESAQNGPHSRYSRKRPATKEDNIERAFIQFEKEKMEMQRQQQKAQNDMDEDVGFFNSLLPHVRQLQPQQKMIFRMRVQQQLYEILYGPYDHQQSARYPLPLPPSQAEPICQVVYSGNQQ